MLPPDKMQRKFDILRVGSVERCWRTIVLALWLCGIGLGLSTSCCGGEAPPLGTDTIRHAPDFLEVTIQAEADAYPLGMPVYVVYDIKNNSADRIDVGFSDTVRYEFAFALVPGHDEVAREVPRAPMDWSGAIQGFIVKPNDAVRGRLLLNRWLLFKKPGVFKLVASAGLTVERVPRRRPMHVEKYLFNVERELTVTITPPDHKRIKAFVEQMNKQLNSPDEGTRCETANQLCFLDDPVRDPIVRSALKATDPYVRSRAVLLLKDPALVTSMLDDKDSNVACMAIYQIATLRGAEVVGLLLDLLTNEDYDKRRAAAGALSQLAYERANIPSVLPAAREALKREKTSLVRQSLRELVRALEANEKKTTQAPQPPPAKPADPPPRP